ncbi:MAG: hypothetical protein ACXWC8_18635 [Limisphaerales bacterium]
MKTKNVIAAALVGIAAVSFNNVRGEDPLPSWNDGPTKQAIEKFVQTTTDTSSKDFVPPEERITTFDQDGPLWVEHPMYRSGRSPCRR